MQFLSCSGFPAFLPLTCRRLFLVVDLNAVQREWGVCVRVCVHACVCVLGGFYCCFSRTALGVEAAFPRRHSGRWARASAGSRARPFAALGSAWPAAGLPRNHRPPGTASAPGPRSGGHRLLGFSSFSRSPTALPRPAPPGPARARGKRGSSLPPGGGKKTKSRRRGRAGARRCIFIRAPAAAEAGAGPSGCGGLRGAGRPRERRARPLCRPGGAGARGALRREAPPVCGASARQGPPGGRGERGAERPRTALRERITVITASG